MKSQKNPYLDKINMIYGSDPAYVIQEKDPNYLTQLENQLGSSFPDEISKLYAEFDGVYQLPSSDCPDGGWIIPKSSEIAIFSKENNWFSETHPDLASSFLIVMYLDGDAVGYIKDNTYWNSQIYDFLHEMYFYEDSQDRNEFLVPLGINFRQYLDDIISKL